MSSQSIPDNVKKVVLWASGKEVKVRTSLDDELILDLVEENVGNRNEMDSGIQEKKQETFMVGHYEEENILVSFHFLYGDECYFLNVDGEHLKLNRAPCRSNPSDSGHVWEPSSDLLKFKKEGTSKPYTLRTVEKVPQYLYKTENNPFILKLDPSGRRVEIQHKVPITNEE